MGALLGAVGETWAIEFPTVRFPFTLSRGVGFLGLDLEGGAIFPWFGWLVTALFLLLGIFSEIAFAKAAHALRDHAMLHGLQPRHGR